MTATTLRRRAWPLYLGVFTTSMSVLLLEIALTRIFSVSLWYHLAFMVISTALLGFGASGTLLAVRPSLLQGDVYRRLRRWATLPWPLPARAALSIGLLAPLGLCMGMPFPLGVRLVEAVNRPLVPWAWAVNGFASVLGSILAVMLAQSYGFAVVMGLAVAVYLLGLLAVTMLDVKRET